MNAAEEIKDLIRFCEMVMGKPLTDFQKTMIKTLDQRRRDGLSLCLHIDERRNTRKTPQQIEETITKAYEGKL